MIQGRAGEGNEKAWLLVLRGRGWEKERHWHRLGNLPPLTSSFLSFVTAFLLRGCLGSLNGQFKPIIYVPNLDLKKGWEYFKSDLWELWAYCPLIRTVMWTGRYNTMEKALAPTLWYNAWQGLTAYLDLSEPQASLSLFLCKGRTVYLHHNLVNVGPAVFTSFLCRTIELDGFVCLEIV